MSAHPAGSPDPTPDDPPFCNTPHPHQGGLVVCTWRPDHDGDHVAGDGEHVTATWAQDDIQLPAEGVHGDIEAGAAAMRAIYLALVAQGFTEAQAVQIIGVMAGTGGGTP